MFEEPLQNTSIDIQCLKIECLNLIEYSHKHYNVKSVTYVTLWRMLFQLEVVGVADYSNILRLVELCFVFAMANAKSEQGFSHMRRIENDYRARLSEMSLSTIMRISMDGLPYTEYDSTEVVNKFS